jgi:hypothetical protein
VKHYIPAFAALAVSFMSSPLVPALKADQSNKKTEITIDQSVAVEGTVLSPGSYVMKVLDSPGDRTIVQIFDADTNHLINTIFAIPAYRVTPADESTFEFYESRDGPGFAPVTRTASPSGTAEASPPSKSFNRSSLLTSRRGCHARWTSPSVPAGGFFKPSAASHY